MRKKNNPKPKVHGKASRKVVSILYKVRHETGLWNIRETSRRLQVNQKYISENIRLGKEPTNLLIREKMGLKNIECLTCHQKLIADKKKTVIKKEKPDFIKQWGHLPVDERHKVIKEYLKWKNK